MLAIGLGLAAVIVHVTKNRFLGSAIAFLIAAAAIITCIFNSSLFEGLIKNLLGSLNLAQGFNNAAFNQIFDVTGVILQLTVIFVFGFLTVQSIEKRRWS